MSTNNTTETNSDSNNDTSSTNNLETPSTALVIPEAVAPADNVYHVAAIPIQDLDISAFQSALNTHKNSLIIDLTNTYESSTEKHFNAASFLALIGTCVVFANLSKFLETQTTVFVLAPIAVINFAYGQYIISRRYPEGVINIPSNWSRFNVGYIISSGLLLGLTSFFLHTKLMPFTLPSSFVSLGAYYMHRATSLQCVIPERACKKATQIIEDQLKNSSLFNHVDIDNGVIRMISEPSVANQV